MADGTGYRREGGDPGEARDWSTVLAFLLFLERDKPGEMWGAHKIEEVIAALERRTGFPMAQIRAKFFEDMAT